jgi:hypothetical protein
VGVQSEANSASTRVLAYGCLCGASLEYVGSANGSALTDAWPAMAGPDVSTCTDAITWLQEGGDGVSYANASCDDFASSLAGEGGFAVGAAASALVGALPGACCSVTAQAASDGSGSVRR